RRVRGADLGAVGRHAAGAGAASEVDERDALNTPRGGFVPSCLQRQSHERWRRRRLGPPRRRLRQQPRRVPRRGGRGRRGGGGRPGRGGGGWGWGGVGRGGGGGGPGGGGGGPARGGNSCTGGTLFAGTPTYNPPRGRPADGTLLPTDPPFPYRNIVFSNGQI